MDLNIIHCAYLQCFKAVFTKGKSTYPRFTVWRLASHSLKVGLSLFRLFFRWGHQRAQLNFHVAPYGLSESLSPNEKKRLHVLAYLWCVVT